MTSRARNLVLTKSQAACLIALRRRKDSKPEIAIQAKLDLTKTATELGALARIGLARQNQSKRWHTTTSGKACLGPDDCENLQDRKKPAIELDKEPAIMVREPDATRQPTPHDIQLMSKHRVLSFKPQLRLEWRGQDGQNETEQTDHSASLGDSITASTRIRFSVHTPRRDAMSASGPGCVK